MSSSIQDLLREWGVPYVEAGGRHTREGWIGTDCPQCGPNSNKFHLGFNLAGRYFFCWRCGWLPARKVLTLWRVPEEGIRLFGETRPVRQVKQPVAGRLREPAGRGPLLSVHRSYLERRGFDPEELERIWGLEALGPWALRLSWRIYIPIFHRGQRVSWTTRAVGGKVQPRYISAAPAEEAVPHKSLVYGLDFCRDSIVVVEGPTDVWRIGPGAGPLMGAAYTPSQVKLIAQIPRRFILLDRDAYRVARRLAGELGAFPGRTVLLESRAEDPGTLGERELARLREFVAQ